MAQLEEAVVATLFDQSDEIADEITHHHPLLAAIEENGNVRRFSGGYEIRKPVMYNDTAVGGFYSGFEAFDLDSTVDWTAFVFAIKQLYEPVAISGRERRANRDEAQLLDLVENKIKAAKARLRNVVSTSLRGDGTGYGGREFDGIKKAVAASPSSGTYGGITRSGNSFTQNEAITGVTYTAANIQEHLTNAICSTTRGSESVDMGFMDRASWKLLHSSMTAIQRITKSDRKAVAGFKSLQYDGVDFFFDDGYGDSSSTLGANTCRLVNSKYWSFDLVRGADFKPLEPKMDRPTDQDAFFTVILVEGNLCCSAPALQVYQGT